MPPPGIIEPRPHIAGKCPHCGHSAQLASFAVPSEPSSGWRPGGCRPALRNSTRSLTPCRTTNWTSTAPTALPPRCWTRRATAISTPSATRRNEQRRWPATHSNWFPGRENPFLDSSSPQPTVPNAPATLWRLIRQRRKYPHRCRVALGRGGPAAPHRHRHRRDAGVHRTRLVPRRRAASRRDQRGTVRCVRLRRRKPAPHSLLPRPADGQRPEVRPAGRQAAHPQAQRIPGAAGRRSTPTALGTGRCLSFLISTGPNTTDG